MVGKKFGQGKKGRLFNPAKSMAGIKKKDGEGG
jgi:hypothetical protein